MKKYIWKQKYSLLGSVLLALLCSLLSVMLIYIVQNLVDSMTTGQAGLLQRMIMLLVGLLAANFIFGYFSVLLEAKISRKLHLDMKKDLFQAILSQRYKDFKKTSIGSKLSVFENDINFVEEYYFNNIFVLIRNVIVLAVAVTYLFVLNIPMGILLLVCSVVILFVPLLLGKNIDPISEEYAHDKGEFIGQLKDYCEGMDVIHAYNIEKHVQKNYFAALNKLESKLFQLRKKLGLYNQTMVTGNYLIIAISFSVGGFLVIKNVISVGELIAITQVMNIIMQPIGEVASALVEMSGSLAVRQKLEHMTERVVQENNQEPDISEPVFSGIECRSISYDTDDGAFSLNKISLSLEPKKKYVVIGPSGCGKTTLLKIIANVLEPLSGDIYINGLNYTECEEMVSKLVSLVHQDTFIFNDTIENNIRLYQDYSPEAFDHAISATVLKEKLKERIQSDCSEGGSSLSGGEKQRLSVARSILRNSPVLLLDEITSALDRETAKTIVGNLFAMEEKTIIFVTHKMEAEFLKKVDCILCMNQGMIIESGSWDELIEEKGYFYKLYAAGQE
ncbi:MULTISPECIES: ABC transporter ATP-binding protein [Blautia]|uniref:ABC transporter ATP-binding protein n=1 Tax=Blautia producta TaxID=33035 RepID=A0ABZ0U8G6_9FIRM|nr:ABC transporter ATP-binding protein [Blautia coccoides]TCO45971.1 ABC-type multidrug transport system fused ATPase/permease subunit [Blautia coccoides]WPX72330.1 putative ABC transporter ATP-binding protein [Blautia coccoides]SUY05736.1 ABC transporter [Blautia coccoides]